MSYINPDYSTMEVMLSTVSYPELDSERKLVGDIVEVRKPDIGAGLRELRRYLWLHMEGIEFDEWAILKTGIKGFEKRRFCIPLERLVQFNSAFDPVKAMDTTIIYQPFLPVDEETGLWLYDPNPINLMGLIYDKETGIFI